MGFRATYNFNRLNIFFKYFFSMLAPIVWAMALIHAFCRRHPVFLHFVLKRMTYDVPVLSAGILALFNPFVDFSIFLTLLLEEQQQFLLNWFRLNFGLGRNVDFNSLTPTLVIRTRLNFENPNFDMSLSFKCPFR